MLITLANMDFLLPYPSHLSPFLGKRNTTYSIWWGWIKDFIVPGF
jgi:hypothetical protein